MFDDRCEAGRILGQMIAAQVANAVVLALPRGGVPVAVEVARQLESPPVFDVFLVRKLGVPGREELAFGAIASGDVRVLNRAVVESMGLANDDIERVIQREQIELQRRERLYRHGRPLTDLRDRDVILVDDGLATGATMIAAVRAVRAAHAKRIVAAAPVASLGAVADLRPVADEVICAETPEPFFAVGYWYRDFEQVTDQEVREWLERFNPARRELASTRHTARQTHD